MKNRAVRRDQEIRKKRKIEKIMKDSWGFSGELMDERNVGKTASTHGKPCSCPMCGNPRKYWNEKTKQEIVAELEEKDTD